MRRGPTILRTASILACALVQADGAMAQTARPGTTTPSAQAMQQVQQLAAERTALQAENARIKSDLEGVRRERDLLKSAQETAARRSRGTEAELTAAEAEKARLEGELAGAKQRFEELVQRYRDAVAQMEDVERDRAVKTQLLAERERELQSSIERNRNLHSLAVEVIDKLEDQGFWSAVARAEPFTRLKRVELENLAEGFRGIAEDNLAPADAGDSLTITD